MDLPLTKQTTPHPPDDPRIEAMHGRDRLGALAFVIALWGVMLFVLTKILPFVHEPTIRIILPVACGGVLLLNTAAIFAMLKHYVEDKHFIYTLDLRHLDEMRRRRG